MKIKLKFLGIFSTIFLFGANPIISIGQVKDRPVDEGHEKAPKEDKVKGATKVTNLFKSETLSIKKEKDEVYKIVIERVRQAPIICKIIRKGKELESISSEKQRKNLVFDINTSLLNVDDNITLTNRKGVAIWEVLVTK